MTSLSFGRSIEMSFKTELIQEGYLGKKTDNYDTIFKGISGRIEFHFADSGPVTVIQAIVDKAKRRTPGTRFNIKFKMNFPSGKRALIIIQDCEFGELPLNFGSRADYGVFNLEFGAEDAKAIAA